MQRIMLILLWLTLSLLATPRDAQVQDDVTPTAPATWSVPTILYPEAWPAPRYPTFSNDTARMEYQAANRATGRPRVTPPSATTARAWWR